MKTTASKYISALFMTTIFAACRMIPAKNLSAVSAGADAPHSVSAGWANVIDMDHQLV